jgi:hypothetical protein
MLSLSSTRSTTDLEKRIGGRQGDRPDAKETMASAEAEVMPSEWVVEEAAGRVGTGTTMIMAAVGGGKE